MRLFWRWFVLTGIMGGALPVLAVSEPGPEVLEQNRRRLEQARRNPDEYARLLQDFRTFRDLSPERQERLRRLDHDLNEEDSATQARLIRALERYASWYEHLGDQQRRRIENAPDGTARLKVVRQIRDRQWQERLPAAYRAELQGLPQGKPRRDRIRELRKEEKIFRREWQQAFPNWAQFKDQAGSEVPDQTLIDFALTELTGEERASLRLSPADPSSRQRLKAEYIKRHADEWQAIQKSDQEKRKKGGK